MEGKAVKEIQAKMKTWTDAGIELAYNSGYEQGCKDQDEKHQADYEYGLEDGRMEAWECVKKIDDMPIDELRIMYSTDDIGWIAKHYSASEAIAKMKEWENSWHIKMPFKNIHGELYCKYSDVQKLYERMKGEDDDIQ